MTFETLELIHGLLKKRLAKLDARVYNARTTMDQLYEKLDQLESETENPDSTVIADVKTAIETAKFLLHRVERKYYEVNRCTKEFEFNCWQ